MTRASLRHSSDWSASLDDAPSRWVWLTRLAFLIIIAVVITRITSVEILRDFWEPTPGSTPVPRGPGPATSLVLDLIAIIPAVLVLARRILDQKFEIVLRHTWLLGAFALVSACWSADKFAAIVGGAQLFSALCLCWATSQIVKDGLHLRLVASICFGLLLVLVAQSVVYKLIDVPANERYWTENKSDILQQHNWKEGSFSALQFEHKILSGELVGFFSSANTFAAVGVMLFAVSAGIGIQRIKDRDGTAWFALPIIAAGCALWIIIEARSKAAGATPLLGIVLFILLYLLRSRFKRHPTRYFWSAVALITLCLLSIIGWATAHNGLFPGHFSNSLDFRWKYWLGSIKVFRDHPWLGVGWNNFGDYYLAHRLPAASEEIKDPHNFLIRFFVELGIVGGVMMLTFLLLRAWNITRPQLIKDPDPSTPFASPTIAFAIALASAGIFLSILVNIDFNQIAADVILELLRRLLYLLALILGAVAGSMINPHHRDLDPRPAPWVYYCICIGLFLLLVHNLIDFSFFEPGPMYVFFLLVGSLLGIAPSTGRTITRRSAIAILFMISILWIAAGGFVAQVIAAEQIAFDANEDIRTAPTDDSRLRAAHYARAAAELRAALDHVPINADYAFRAARAHLSAGQYEQADTMLLRAIQINPMLIDAYLLQANAELHKPTPDASLIRTNFEKILRLNPNDVSLHTQYGQALEKLGSPQLARAEYELALTYNNALPPGEPKRLDSAQLNDLEERIKRIGK